MNEFKSARKFILNDVIKSIMDSYLENHDGFMEDKKNVSDLKERDYHYYFWNWYVDSMQFEELIEYEMDNSYYTDLFIYYFSYMHYKFETFLKTNLLTKYNFKTLFMMEDQYNSLDINDFKDSLTFNILNDLFNSYKKEPNSSKYLQLAEINDVQKTLGVRTVVYTVVNLDIKGFLIFSIA